MRWCRSFGWGCVGGIHVCQFVSVVLVNNRCHVFISVVHFCSNQDVRIFSGYPGPFLVSRETPEKPMAFWECSRPPICRICALRQEADLKRAAIEVEEKKRLEQRMHLGLESQRQGNGGRGCGSKPFWYRFGVGAPPILGICFSDDWDVHWGYGLLTHSQRKPSGVQVNWQAGLCGRVLGLLCLYKRKPPQRDTVVTR